MAADLIILEAVTLYCGDDDTTDGKFLTLKTIKLPALTETFVDHKPAGSRFNVKLGMGMEALECPFKLEGYDPKLMAQMGLGQRGKRKYTVRGKLVDKLNDIDIPLEAIMYGKLGKVERNEFQRGELNGADYSISEIMQYEEIQAGEELYYWVFRTNTWRVGGIDQNASENSILGIY
jgi:hypothetical protein